MIDNASIQPVHGVSALKVNSCFVISDLHIGVETHMMKKGFHVTSRTEEMFDSIIENSKDCNRLIILGDVKDSVPGSSKQEFREIPDFFERLYERFDMIDIVRGNHDTNLEEFLNPKIRIRPASGIVVDGVGMFHGHTWPSKEVMKCETVIFAHEHPAVMFRDGIGKQTTEPCWVRGKFISGCDRYETFPKEFIIIPSFNKLLGGSPMNTIRGKFLGPMLNENFLDLDECEFFLLDGVNLGKRKDLMVDSRYDD